MEFQRRQCAVCFPCSPSFQTPCDTRLNTICNSVMVWYGTYGTPGGRSKSGNKGRNALGQREKQPPPPIYIYIYIYIYWERTQTRKTKNRKKEHNKKRLIISGAPDANSGCMPALSYPKQTVAASPPLVTRSKQWLQVRPCSPASVAAVRVRNRCGGQQQLERGLLPSTESARVSTVSTSQQQ